MDATVYLPTVAWRTIARNVIVLTAETISDPATYRVTVKPEDINELGAIAVDIAINYYFKDYIGHTYRIIAYSKANPSAITIDIADEFRVGVGAQEGRMAIVYKSVGEGLSPYLAPIYYRHLDRVALEYSRQFELDILWRKEQTANHSDLTNLAWTSSGHTGTSNKLAGFGSGGESIYVDPIVNTDEKVKYDAADISAGYLSEKIVAGTNITIEEGIGADENKLKISSTGGGSTTYLGLTDTSDTTYTGKDKYVPMVDEPNSELDLTPTVLATLLKLDGPTSYVGAGGYSVKIKQTLDGFEFLPDGMNQISPSTSVGIPNNYSKIVADELVLSSTVDLTIVGSGSLTII